MEEQKDEMPEENLVEDEETSSSKQWLQDNLRIIISVLIVVVIAGGIYSYSQRSEAPTVSQQDEQEDVLEKIAGDDNTKDSDSAIVSEEDKKEETKPEETKKEEPKKEETQTTKQETQKKSDQTSSVSTSQETEKSFVETATKGDSHTKLARRALANYLEKTPDSALTPEHKIYIEDYLRRRVSDQGSVQIGTSVEFSKDLIREAISKSKSLDSNQLQNLHQYAVRVPSLS